MYYRFNCGAFVEADSFAQAQQKFIERIQSETENEDQWHKCTCVGFSHRYDCPEHVEGI